MKKGASSLKSNNLTKNKETLAQLLEREDRSGDLESERKPLKIILNASGDCQAQPTPLSRMATVMRLIRLALSDPLLTMKLVNPRMLKNLIDFLIKGKVDSDHIVNKYKDIYLRPHQKNTFLSRLSAVIKLACVAFLSPGLTIKMFNQKFIKNTFKFLSTNETEPDHILKKYQQIYFKSNFESTLKLHDGVKEFVSWYGLPLSMEKDSNAKIKPHELAKWTEKLRQLANNIPEDNPTISIIIPVYNHIRFTLACIHSILINAGRTDFEIIIADDMSVDKTSSLFDNDIRRVRYHRNKTNLGFLNNCNLAAKHAKGRFIVFLNNDTIILPGWLDELIRPLEKNSSIGLAGAKLIYPDGRLQEAGGIIFSDASGWNYGRFDDPCKVQYNYMRDVDYCSGASIAISAELWRQLGGFDSRYSPAYYEDTDLAFQVREAGKRVVYQPLSEVIHFEGISHGTSEEDEGKQHQSKNKLKFLSKWKNVLPLYGTCNPKSLPTDRSTKKRILVVDAITPTPDKDSGSLDAYNYLKIFKELEYHVTFIPENLMTDGKYTRSLQRLGVECIHLPWFTKLSKAIEYYAPLADYIFLYRVTVAAPLVDIVRQYGPQAKLIFDTVDLHFLREEREAEISKSQERLTAAKKTREIELGVIKKSDAIILLSKYEQKLLSGLIPEARLFHIPVVREIPGPSEVPWEKRHDIVFIGGYQHPPNIDAVLFFVNEVWPELKKLGFSGRFIIAGSKMPDEISALATNDIIVKGYVPDVSDLFDSCRLSVAPLRYGAGMKGKVITSLGYGVPCVVTSLATEGTGLVSGEQILVEDDPNKMARLIHQAYEDKDLWERLSEAGLNYCIENCSIDSVKKKLNLLLSELSEL